MGIRQGLSLAVAGAALVAGAGTAARAGTAADGTTPAGRAAASAAKYVQMSGASAPDPDLAVFGSRYYVYATGGRLPVFTSRSSSLRGGFAAAGTMFSRVPAGFSALWAPHVIHVGSWYIAFFTASRNGANHAVYWTYSRYPDHGFSESPVPIANGGGGAWEAIDPTVYAAGTKRYLVWKRGEYTGSGFPHGNFQIRARGISISASGAKPAVTLAAGTSRALVSVTGGLCMEAPSLIHNGKLWLFVSRGAYNDKTSPPDANSYRTEAWSAPGIAGKFTSHGTVLKTGQGWGVGPGGASVIAHGGITYIAYHAWAGNTRVTRFARLTWGSGVPVAKPLPAGASA